MQDFDHTPVFPPRTWQSCFCVSLRVTAQAFFVRLLSASGNDSCPINDRCRIPAQTSFAGRKGGEWYD
ncbi:hypothetical protein HBH98_059820 [Parastagonospora nodorum]|nr:hypothetical protein HBH50_072600 [Parastagonospora nodorum]KAH4094987.1 hypothetical protein HBH48_060860 [Parastagonospora nodorum]KAH4139538.1 hypothetical protein HBH45_093430 [Parastagonospora nodorum]KAH4165221.1 hypothetical protein HBH43_141830 [Parastagonospora nodorum]KAH4202631.1 hypothetical protein HBH42_020690 [Parastagonospora nodorum]